MAQKSKIQNLKSKMSFEWFIAKRYISSNRRSGFISFITGFSIAGVALGTAALIITLSILAGFEKEIKEKVFGFMTHIQVQGFQGQPLPDHQNSIEMVKAQVRGISGIAPYVAKEAMICAGDNVDGIFLKGIDVRNDISKIYSYMKEGEYLDRKKDSSEIVIGKKLARKLNVTIGDKVIVFGLPKGGTNFQPKAAVFRVAGIFESGMAEYDDIYAYTKLAQAQKLFGLGDGVSGYDVLVDSLPNASFIASEIQTLLGYPHYALTAAQLYRNLFAWIDLQKKPAPILLGLIIIVATVNIIGTLLMVVLERTQEIGSLKSIGASSKGIQNIFLIQGGFIASVGVVVGNILAFILCFLQMEFQFFSLPSDIYFMSTVPILLRWENFVLVSIVVIVLCLLSSIIPSRAAAKLDPVTTLRFR
ncbi:MAG: ABC transporter permease [Bacteroidota bacterium]|nr:ABC transporter permease [Bacteroidota bacterium]